MSTSIIPKCSKCDTYVHFDYPKVSKLDIDVPKYYLEIMFLIPGNYVFENKILSE